MRGLTFNSGNLYGLSLTHDISLLLSAYIQSNRGDAGALGLFAMSSGIKKKKRAAHRGPQATAPGALLRYHKQPH